MKNKHLLLLFGSTLLLGLFARYSPWFKNEIFHSALVRLDTAKIERISIAQAGQAELLLERSDEGWVASQDDFAVRTADSLLNPILTSLAAINARRIVRTQERDTLGLMPAQAIHVEVFMQNGAKERFDIGREIWEGNTPATYVEIDRHDGIYLTDNHLRQIFARQINDFRSKVVLDFLPNSFQSAEIFGPNTDSLTLQKSDTIVLLQHNKLESRLSLTQVQSWMQYLQELNGLPFATATEERLAIDHWAATVSLAGLEGEEPVTLQFFATASIKPYPNRATPHYLLQSSQNPFSFFAMADSALVRKILSGPFTAHD